MSLFGYRVIIFILLPFVAFAAFKRCRKASNIKHCFTSRFGLNPQKFQTGGIWIHAVSVGETRSVFPLLTALKKQYPNKVITLTSGSIQGAIQALSFSPVTIQHQMIPYDYPFAINRFIKQIKPSLVIMIETEIWPNLYHACTKQNIPIVLANARLKNKSFQSYQKYAPNLVKKALNQTQFIAAQFPQDALNFKNLGVNEDKIKLIGNIKSDIVIEPNLDEIATKFKQQNNLEKRFIWVAASTHGAVEGNESEESLLLKAHQKLLQVQPNALLILVPRHPERFAQVAKEVRLSNSLVVRSDKHPILASTQVYLADTVGEMMTWFKVADVAFVGGSLVPFGGHNIMEPASLGKPTLSGIHYQNLKALFDEFIKEDAVLISNNEHQLAEQLIQLLTDRKQAGENALSCFKKQAGSLKKLLTLIKPLIKITTKNH